MTNDVYQTREEVVSSANTIPTEVVRTTTHVEPQVVVSPRRMYEGKKAVFQVHQVIWYILGVIEVLLAFRFFLKIITTSTASAFVNFIYNLSEIFVFPFKGIVADSVSSRSIVEWSTVIAMIVWAVAALLIIYLVDLANPVSPRQIEESE
jgi:hypothetical protein